MKHKKQIHRFVLVVILGLFVASIIWFWNGWTEYLQSDVRMRVPGRDTVVFWELKQEEFQYQICHSVGDYYFYAYDSLYTSSHPYRNIQDVHFYANTTDCIFIITNSNDFYCVTKATGAITSSLPLAEVPMTEKQVCFINLYHDKRHIIKEYYE